ncbi:MAG: DUF5666 domain-containing protein [Candidatus Dormibacteria bacterium]
MMSWPLQLTRGTRRIAIGGLAVGIGVGAMVAVTAATSPSPSPTAAPGAPAGPDASAARKGHHGGAVRRALMTGGTITAINGSSLTLRTEPGAETVTTSDATTYHREHDTIKFSDLHVGDIVHVRAAAGSTPSTAPGTGTVAAGAITVVVPALGGRVTDISGDTVSLVGRDGRLLTVTLTGGTKYYKGRDAADRAAITKDSRIRAAGAQDSLTHLTADVVTVLPDRPALKPPAAPGLRSDLLPPGPDVLPVGDAVGPAPADELPAFGL